MCKMRPHLSTKNNHLHIREVDAVELAEEFGTPLYVVDEDRIRERYRDFVNAFSGYPRVEVKYAYKANTSLSVCRVLAQEGAGADVLSEGELYIALLSGVDAKYIIFTGNNKSDGELEYALDSGVIINLDALHELERLERICARKKERAKVSFRINPAVSPETHPHLSTGLRESKFGIPGEEALAAYGKAVSSEYLEVAGIHMHIGSQITSTAPYEAAAGKLFDVVGVLKKELDLDLEFVDLGGGVGIKYQEDAAFITPEELAEVLLPLINAKIKEHGLRPPALYFEPGRYLVGDAGMMLCKVSTIKRTPYKKFIGTDAGFHTLVRPTMYGAYHEVVVANRVENKEREVVDVAGNVCESGDILARDRDLPKIEEGDILAFLDAGAYSMIMASQYNSRPLPAEVLVKGSRYDLIRERGTFADLLARQHVPARLSRQ